MFHRKNALWCLAGWLELFPALYWCRPCWHGWPCTFIDNTASWEITFDGGISDSKMVDRWTSLSLRHLLLTDSFNTCFSPSLVCRVWKAKNYISQASLQVDSGCDIGSTKQRPSGKTLIWTKFLRREVECVYLFCQWPSSRGDQYCCWQLQKEMSDTEASWLRVSAAPQGPQFCGASLGDDAGSSVLVPFP